MTSLKGIQVSSNTEGKPMTNETEFRVGDVVKFLGVEGEIVEEQTSSHLPFKVMFATGHAISFYKDGKFFDWAKETSLKLISRPKKKRKVELRAAIQRRPGDDLYMLTHTLFENETAARADCGSQFVALSQHAEILEFEED